jgi:putative acetyltransferase
MRARAVEVRERREGDQTALLDTWVASWAQARPDLDFEARRSWFVDHLRGLQETGSLILVAECDGELMGAVVIHPATGYLDQIWTDPAAKGLGVADDLMAAARRVASGAIELHVNQDNARAIRFYEKQGFVVAGTGVNPRSGAPIYLLRWTQPTAA